MEIGISKTSRVSSMEWFNPIQLDGDYVTTSQAPFDLPTTDIFIIGRRAIVLLIEDP